MTTLSIKDVPDDVAERLRQRAARNHRSLQGELMAIVEQAVKNEPDPERLPAAAPVPAWSARSAFAGVALGVSGRVILRRGSKMIEQIATEHRARFPEPIGSGPNAVDIIRAERDAQ
jgi:plasmid stability protein